MSIKMSDGMALPEVLDPNTVYLVYVDDDRSLAMTYPPLLRAKLNNGGIVEKLAERQMNIEVVSDYSVDALEVLQGKSLHRVVILSDNNMPQMNGTELLSRLRDVDSEVPMALLSALPDDAKKDLPDNVKDVQVFSKPNNDFSAITKFIIPNVLAAADKPALPAVQKPAGAKRDLDQK